METLFFHGKTTNNQRFTIAGKFENEGDTLLTGISLCSNNDMFVKTEGRKKAEGRLSTKKNIGITRFRVTEPQLTQLKSFHVICEMLSRKSSNDLQKMFNLHGARKILHNHEQVNEHIDY